MSVKPIPEGYRSVTPYLIVKKGSEALAFYKRAFDAQEVLCLRGPDGRIVHAEFRIGDSLVMMADECAENPITRSPHTIGGTSVSIHLYVEDVDTSFQKALSEGATERRPVEDRFYGDRSGVLEDPFGQVWSLSTHKEDLSNEEIGRRARELFQKTPA